MIKDPENGGLLNQLLELRAENEYLARLSDVELQEFVGDLEEVACAEGDTLIELGETVDELDVLRDLESEVEIITLAGGETLFEHGDPGDSAYIVMSGRLRVVLDLEAGEECTLNELGRGEVLGGGGARGFAHLGVIRAMEELGIPIDMIGGSSIGAPVAGPTAQGQSAAEALQTIAHHFRSLLDYTLPLASLLAGRRITESIEKGPERGISKICGSPTIAFRPT